MFATAEHPDLRQVLILSIDYLRIMMTLTRDLNLEGTYEVFFWLIIKREFHIASLCLLGLLICKRHWSIKKKVLCTKGLN